MLQLALGLFGAGFFRKFKDCKKRFQDARALEEIKDDIFQAEEEFRSLCESQYYFSKKQYHNWTVRWNHLKKPIEDYINRNVAVVDFHDSVLKINSIFVNGENLVKNRNETFIENEIKQFKEYFQNLESYPLTQDQMRSIVIDEEHNLVVAGAGTGKTTTIIGKVGYITKKGLVSPDEVLLIAFNRDVVKEMGKRVFSRLDLELNVKTYHSLGLNIIAESEGEKPSVSDLSTDRIKLQQKILGFIEQRREDEAFLHLFNEYFLFYYVPYESILVFKSMGEYIEYLKNHDIRSLKGDRVKSYEECIIANFLYMNGIEYQYEAPFHIQTVTQRHRQYKPDFYLPANQIYIEHFGIDRQGNPAPFMNKQDYLTGMTWKRNLHRQYDTTFIETYSYQKAEGILLRSLEEKLRKAKVIFTPIPRETLFDELDELGRIPSFASLLATFLNLFKSSGITLKALTDKVDSKNRRTQIFLELFSKIFTDYTKYLDDTGEIDFNDMINKAIDYVKQGSYVSKFKYILVDEFQDTSQSRYRLLKSLLNQNDSCKLFCVGDDWQSIYRFTSSDLSIMLDFQHQFNFTEISFLERTFRLNDKLCEFSTKFILENPNQIKKKLNSHNQVYFPSVTLVNGTKIDDMVNIIDEIDKVEAGKASVFIIGRYNYLKPFNLEKIQQAYPVLNIRYTTAHSSKGLEADYVILFGLINGIYGFPCQIVDDPILNLVLAKEDRHPNAEERRLFYVAITRARKHVYLLTDEYRTSTFINEIQRKGYDINIREENISCPLCKLGKVILRKSRQEEFYGCSNYPYCEYRKES